MNLRLSQRRIVMPHEQLRETTRPVVIRRGSVSVALCTYNGARYLPRQLQSYLMQDRIPDELVVGDDGSTDETKSLIEDFARSAPFPVHFHANPSQLGVGRNFDQTIQRCTGEFIALSDQDDEWRTDKLSRLVGLLEMDPQAGYACSDADMIGEESQSLNGRQWQQYKCPPNTFLAFDSDARGRHLLLQSDRILGATMVLRAASIRSLSPIPTTWVHDHWYSVLCELTGAHGVCTPELLTRYRLHGQQTCGIRRAVGPYRQKKRTLSDRQAHRVRRHERLIDLRRHLVDRLIPLQPELARWLPLLDEAERIAEQAIVLDNLSWWHRKLARIRQWWMSPPSPAIRLKHGMDPT